MTFRDYAFRLVCGALARTECHMASAPSKSRHLELAVVNFERALVHATLPGAKRAAIVQLAQLGRCCLENHGITGQELVEARALAWKVRTSAWRRHALATVLPGWRRAKAALPEFPSTTRAPALVRYA